MRARSIAPLEAESYQRAARLILSRHLVTASYPDRSALPLLRRWATELREDLLELFGFRLEVTETTARLFTVVDRLDPDSGTRTATDRPFDRRRYAYLALVLAALGRAGAQISLSELAEYVVAESSRVEGVEFAPSRGTDRDAFVDVVGWLTMRGAITVADGDAGGWARDPAIGEALYDIDRAVVTALFRPPQALQHIDSVRALLAPVSAGGTQEVARRMRRALVQRPVVYAEELDDEEAVQLALPRTAADVALLTGLVVERRAEGVALVGPSGRLSDVRFPGTGTVAQVALLLAGEICDRVLDADAPEPVRVPLPMDTRADLVAAVDAALPRSGMFTGLRSSDDTAGEPVAEVPSEREPRPVPEHPLVEDAWLAETVSGLVDTYGRTFASQWQADPGALTQAAIGVLAGQRLVARVPGGVLALPALARFRGVTVSVRRRDPHLELFPRDREATATAATATVASSQTDSSETEKC